MEELQAMFRVCIHIKSDGIRCNSPAMKGMNFCFQHIGGKINSLTRARATTSAPNAILNLVYPGDRESIQHNLFLVAQAFSEGKIDVSTANTYNRLFRTCELNLRRWEKANQDNPKKQMSPLTDVILSEAVKGSESEEPAFSQSSATEPSESSASSAVNDNSSPETDSSNLSPSDPEPGDLNPAPRTRILTREEIRARIKASDAEYYAEPAEPAPALNPEP